VRLRLLVLHEEFCSVLITTEPRAVAIKMDSNDRIEFVFADGPVAASSSQDIIRISPVQPCLIEDATFECFARTSQHETGGRSNHFPIRSSFLPKTDMSKT
jgi:hypothetical protein